MIAPNRPVRAGAVGVAAAFVLMAWAGCIGVGDVTVPSFRAGDWALYADGTRVEILGMTTVAYPDEPAPRDVLEVKVWQPNGTWPTAVFLRIDPSTGYALEGSRTCAHFMENRCWQNLTETTFYRDLSVPWGFGSSLVQGMTLSHGDAFERTFETDAGRATVRFTVEDVDQRSGVQQAHVRAAPVSTPNATATYPWLEGTFVVSSDSPFVSSVAATMVPVDSTTASRPIVTSVKAERVDQGRGTEPVDVALSGTKDPTRMTQLAVYWGYSSHVPPGDDYWFASIDGSFEEAVSYALEEGIIHDVDGIVYMSMRKGGQGTIGPGGTSVSQTEWTVYSLHVQMGPDTITEYDIIRENQTTLGGVTEDATFSHEVAETKTATASRASYGHVLGFDAAAELIESTLPYATQYVAVGAEPDGVYQAADRPARFVYTFSWLHSMGTDPGESAGGIRQSVKVDADAGFLRYVYGPHGTPDDAPPWTVASANGP